MIQSDFARPLIPRLQESTVTETDGTHAWDVQELHCNGLVAEKLATPVQVQQQEDKNTRPMMLV